MAKTVFDLNNSNSIFSLNKNQRIHSPLSQASKTFVSNIFYADFRVTFNICWGPAIKERGIIEGMKFWNWGPTTIRHNKEYVAFFLKILTIIYCMTVDYQVTCDSSCVHFSCLLRLPGWLEPVWGTVLPAARWPSHLDQGIQFWHTTNVLYRRKYCF